MKKPNFFCTQFIECHSYLPKFQPADCLQQCSQCQDSIIDHHLKKKIIDAEDDFANGRGITFTIEELKDYVENYNKKDS